MLRPVDQIYIWIGQLYLNEQEMMWGGGTIAAKFLLIFLKVLRKNKTNDIL
jgi:hypothetical protein